MMELSLQDSNLKSYWILMILIPNLMLEKPRGNSIVEGTHLTMVEMMKTDNSKKLSFQEK